MLFRSVRTDVSAVRADTSASQEQILAARLEAVSTALTLQQLKAIIEAAKAAKGGK